jgi:hypothetical protein
MGSEPAINLLKKKKKVIEFDTLATINDICFQGSLVLLEDI